MKRSRDKEEEDVAECAACGEKGPENSFGACNCCESALCENCSTQYCYGCAEGFCEYCFGATCAGCDKGRCKSCGLDYSCRECGECFCQYCGDQNQANCSNCGDFVCSFCTVKDSIRCGGCNQLLPLAHKQLKEFALRNVVVFLTCMKYIDPPQIPKDVLKIIGTLILQSYEEKCWHWLVEQEELNFLELNNN